MFTIYGGKTEFKQWEQGQRVTNPKLAVGDKVRFWNQSGETHPMIAYKHEGVVVADVPNDLLQHCSPILVELCGDPECLSRFVVTAQDKPADYDFIDNTHCAPAVPSGTGGVSSWNDLTDKPFYIEEKEIFFVEETTVEFAEGQALASAKDMLVPGDKYTVMWDGQKYECVAQSFTDGVVIGNLGAAGIGEHTEEPFVIIIGQDTDGTLLCVIADTSGTGAATHTVSVSGVAKIVHKLDDVFIDTSVPFVDLNALGMPSLTQNAKGWASIDVDEIVINKIFDTIKKGKPIDFKLTRIVGDNVHSDVYRFLLTAKSGNVAYGANISDIDSDTLNGTYGLVVAYVNCVVGDNNVPSRIDAKLISTVGA